MDAITRVSFYFPTRALTSFWILSNVVINNQAECEDADKQVLIAVIVIFALFVAVVAFTDTYLASNNQSYPVVIFPFYGPVCFHLPTLEDKDQVYDAYYLKVRDYLHALLSLATFTLIAVFINPISNCLYPSEDLESSDASKLSDSTVRTVPIVVALVCAMLMMCLGPPRQMLGYSNVPETCPPLEQVMGDNPIFTDDSPDLPEDDMDSDMGAGPMMMGKGGGSRKGYAASYRSNMSHRHPSPQSQMSMKSYNQQPSMRSRSPSPAPRDYGRHSTSRRSQEPGPAARDYARQSMSRSRDPSPGPRYPPQRDEEEGYYD